MHKQTMSCSEEDEQSSLAHHRDSFPHMSIYGLAIRHGSLVHRGSSSSIRPEQDIVSTEGRSAGSLLFSFVTPRPMKYFFVCLHTILYSWQIWTNIVLGEPHPRRNNKTMNNTWITWLVPVCSIVINLSYTACIFYHSTTSIYLPLLWNKKGLLIIYYITINFFG